MKKAMQAFIAWFLITLLAITAPPLVLSQQVPSSQPASPEDQIEGAPVVFEGKTLFVFKNNFGSLSPQARQRKAEKQIAEFATNYAVPPDDLEVTDMAEEGVPVSIIVAGAKVISFVTEQDAKLVGKKRQELANEQAQKILLTVQQYRQERSFEHLVQGIIFSAIATLVLILALWIANKLFVRAYQRFLEWKQTHIHAVRWGDFELIGANQLDTVITFVTKTIQAAITLGLFVVYLTFVLKQFPWTKGFTSTFWGNLLGALESGWQSFVVYLPNLLTIVLVLVLTYFLIRLSKTFFQELSQGSVTLPGFYADWAWPTFRLMTIFILALAAVIIFPLLPGFQSPAFQGISLFLGLLISLGSTAVIANIISGSVLIYTRSFRIGDSITIDKTTGQVIEKNLLVTRILTSTNVVVSIPNSKIIAGSIENLNFAAQELNEPLMIKTQVYLGYEIPWRQAYAALIEAALRMNGVNKSTSPIVLQGELNQVYVTYLLKVYLDLEFFREKTPKEFEQARSQLHENIRDCCAQAGIRIFAPNYQADPTNFGPAANN